MKGKLHENINHSVSRVESRDDAGKAEKKKSTNDGGGEQQWRKKKENLFGISRILFAWEFFRYIFSID